MPFIDTINTLDNDEDLTHNSKESNIEVDTEQEDYALMSSDPLAWKAQQERIHA